MAEQRVGAHTREQAITGTVVKRRGVLAAAAALVAGIAVTQTAPPVAAVDDTAAHFIAHAAGKTGFSTEGATLMTYAPLDPKEVVILFADLQTGIIELSMTNELAHLRRAVSALAKLAHLFDIPAIVTTAPAEGGPRVTPEIAAALGDLPLHTRTTTDAFTHAPTRDAITTTGRKTLLIAGVATEIIVQHSALSGAAQGLDVQVVVDACGGLSPRTEDAALRRLTQAGVVTTSIASIAGQLAGDFTQPQGSNALGIFYEFVSG